MNYGSSYGVYDCVEKFFIRLLTRLLESPRHKTLPFGLGTRAIYLRVNRDSPKPLKAKNRWTVDDPEMMVRIPAHGTFEAQDSRLHDSR